MQHRFSLSHWLRLQCYYPLHEASTAGQIPPQQFVQQKEKGECGREGPGIGNHHGDERFGQSLGAQGV